MAAMWLMSVKALSQDLSVQEALSGIFGSVSLATWIFLLVSEMTCMKIYSGELSLTDV